MRRSWQRMKNLESKMRSGMTANGIAPEIQEQVIEQIGAFALYGFATTPTLQTKVLRTISERRKVEMIPIRP